MRILAIETSCDETAVALMEISGKLNKPEIKILGNTLLSQVALHEQYGGVYPRLAKREHEKNLPIILEQTLREAGENVDAPHVDYIAVTAGPGLEPALWAGITFAQELGKKWDKPVLGVNHMEGHICSVLYGDKPEVRLPALALLVSGGHTELVLVKEFGHYEILGRTLDDAVGEAFDKAARMLGLAYPGGPKLSKLAELSRQKKAEIDIKFPRPMLHSGDLNFSFSGLKTAVLYKLRSDARTDDEYKEDVARAFEDAAIEVLVEKTRKALESLGDKVKTLIVGGGVAANARLALELEKLEASFPDLTLLMPERTLTTDNALMIGIAAFENIMLNPEILKTGGELKARGNLSFKI
jgi:N6-L-threonylcarbamoyladenine synthase